MDTLEDIKRLIASDYKRKTTRWSKEARMCDVILAGDSMVAYYQTHLPICLQGIAGDTTLGLLNRLDLIKKTNPSHVFIHVGTNDIILDDISIFQTIENLKTIEKMLFPIKVKVISPLPVIEKRVSQLNHQRTNLHLKTLTQNIKEVFPNNHLDLFHVFFHMNDLESHFKEDGLHLNDRGYNVYESYLKLKLEEIR
jgi:lysophospholipase L1-like esterase